MEEARETVENESADVDEDTDDEMIVEVDGKEYKAGESIVIHVERQDFSCLCTEQKSLKCPFYQVFQRLLLLLILKKRLYQR